MAGCLWFHLWYFFPNFQFTISTSWKEARVAIALWINSCIHPFSVLNCRAVNQFLWNGRSIRWRSVLKLNSKNSYLGSELRKCQRTLFDPPLACMHNAYKLYMWRANSEYSIRYHLDFSRPLEHTRWAYVILHVIQQSSNAKKIFGIISVTYRFRCFSRRQKPTNNKRTYARTNEEKKDMRKLFVCVCGLLEDGWGVWWGG